MKRYAIFPLVFALLFSTGCSGAGLFDNYRSIEQLQLVHTLGMDLHPDGVQVTISGGEPDSGKEDSSGPGMIRLTATGKDIHEAVAQLQQFAGKEELYFAHARYVLVGEAYGKNGLQPVIDYLEHSPQLRSDLPLFIVKGGTAQDLLTKTGGEKHTVYEQLEAVVRSCTKDGAGYPFTCGDIAIFNAERGCALACALDVTATSTANSDAEEEEVTPLAAGYAIIKDGKLAGYLSREGALCMNLLLGQWSNLEVTTDLMNRPVTLQFAEVKPTLVPEFSRSGTLSALTVNLQADVTLQNGTDMDKATLQAPLEQRLEQWMEEIFRAMRSTEADFPGFGDKLRLKHPDWQGDMTKNIATLRLTADVQCKVFADP